IQVIDGTGTFTLSDSQPCRLLTSLRRSYPASSVIRNHPSSATAGAGPRGFAVGSEERPLYHDRRLPLLHTVHVPCVLPSLPRWDRRLRFSLASPTTATFPVRMAGRLPH